MPDREADICCQGECEILRSVLKVHFRVKRGHGGACGCGEGEGARGPVLRDTSHEWGYKRGEPWQRVKDGNSREFGAFVLFGEITSGRGGAGCRGASSILEEVWVAGGNSVTTMNVRLAPIHRTDAQMNKTEGEFVF